MREGTEIGGREGEIINECPKIPGKIRRHHYTIKAKRYYVRNVGGKKT